MAQAVLTLQSVYKSFGGIRAIDDLSFDVENGEIVGLIGPNGSGKSTTVNVVSGRMPVTTGDILLSGQPLTATTEQDRVELGLARTFQTASLYTDFTVFDQVLLACHTRIGTGPLASIFRSRAERQERAEKSAHVEEILHMTGLWDVRNETVQEIPSAQQRLAMIATALATDPKVLMLDEPAAGMVSQERQALADLIRAIRDKGISILLIEHHMSLIMEVCDKIVVLNFGGKIAEGTPAEIRNNPKVIDAYLGEAH